MLDSQDRGPITEPAYIFYTKINPPSFLCKQLQLIKKYCFRPQSFTLRPKRQRFCFLSGKPSLVFIIYPVQEYSCLGLGGTCTGIELISGACNESFLDKG